ncbi:MAG: hypothetical protein IPK53_03245 [bacterium]|nr:hypothetical protein [bacterium]
MDVAQAQLVAALQQANAIDITAGEAVCPPPKPPANNYSIPYLFWSARQPARRR